MAGTGFVNRIGVLPEPLVCLHGKERPNYVPEYVGEGECGMEESIAGMAWIAEKLMTHRIDPYCQSYRCQSLHAISQIVGFNFPSQFKPIEVETSIPNVLNDFDLLIPPHPFFNITHRLNLEQLQDFRSGLAFIEASSLVKEKLVGQGQRDLTVLHVGSGSHIGDLVLALELIDQDVIDEAHYIHTELNYNYVDMVRAYLQALSEGKDPLFTDYTEEENYYGEDSYEIIFSWKYKDKPMSMTFSLNMSGYKFSRDDYVQAADVVVAHHVPVDWDFFGQVYDGWQRSAGPKIVMTDENDFDYLQDVLGQHDVSEVQTAIISEGYGGGGHLVSKENYRVWSLDSAGEFVDTGKPYSRKYRKIDPYFIESFHTSTEEGAVLTYLPAAGEVL